MWQDILYNLVANGKLKASRLSSRMAFVRKVDIEKMFESNPYKRVIPCSKSKDGHMLSYYLDYYPGYRDESTMKVIRHESLGIHTMLRPCIETCLSVLLPNGIEKE